MPYAPFGFQTPIPREQFQSPWLPTPQPPGPPMQPNGLPDLSGVGAFGEQGFRAGLDQFGPDLLREYAPMLLGGPAGRALSMAPRVAAGAYGAMLPMLPGMAHGAEKAKAASDPVVMEMQTDLKRRGYYKGKIDGIMEEQTRSAKEAFERDEAAKADRAKGEQADKVKLMETEEKLRQGEAQRKRDEEAAVAGKARAEENAAGQKKMALPEYKDPSFMEQYGPWIGLPLGYGLSRGIRKGFTAGINQAETAVAGRADLLAGQAGNGTVPERVGRVNQFWTEGKAGAQPFTETPGTRPFPYTPNPQAPPSSDLYRRGPFANFAPPGTTMGMGAAEAAGGAYLSAGAREELDAAQKAVGEHASETNIQRLLQARQALARNQFLMRFGLGAIGGGITGEMKARTTGAPIRPGGIGRMESERGQLDIDLAPPPVLPASRTTRSATIGTGTAYDHAKNSKGPARRWALAAAQ